MNEYYIKVRITYINFSEYLREQCYVRISFSDAQVTLYNAMHAILTKFYSMYENSDIISIEVIENKLY